MQLTRTDVERIIENLITEQLTLESSVNMQGVTVSLMLGRRELSQVLITADDLD